MSRSSETTGSDLEPIPDLQVRLFGPLSVRVEGVPLAPLRTRKGAWLLALLLLKHPRPLDRAWLAGTLWPDTDPAAALKNLRNTLSDLRHVLGPQQNRIHSPTPSTLALDLDGADVDLTAFDATIAAEDLTALDQAVSLYTGPLLEGCGEEWVVLEREQRQQACLHALETLAAAELQSGQAGQAAQRLRRCVGLDALRETAQCALMGALAASGDYAGATQAYRGFRLLLHEELHTQPAAATTALYQQMRVRARQAAAHSAAASLLPLCHSRPADESADLPPLEELDRSESADALHPRKRLDPPDLPNNLPQQADSFIGREKEVAEVSALLQRTRLLTLMGSGGCGKTRLALQVAAEVLHEYAEGVWLVELAPLSDPSLVAQTVAQALGILEQAGEPMLQTLIERLKGKRLLLLLDNCEHLMGACAELASVLLRSCPQVKVLATSRERLGIAGEQTYRIPPLSLPDPRQRFPLEALSQYEAVRLFIERALLVKADFRLTNTNAPSVASICHRLDGIPLAIELAAARVRVLAVEHIDSRLDNRFRLLIGGDRMALPRQQTLRALMDWSYDLLNAEERLLLSHLSVFAGGWTLEAAERVCGSEEGVGSREWGVGKAPQAPQLLPTPYSLLPNEVLDLLGNLVDKSLVIAEEQEGRVRYRMLETVRQYAHDRLVESGERDGVRGRHRGYFLALAEAAEPKLTGAEQVEWFQRLEAEHENLRSALEWSLKSKDEGGRSHTKDEGGRMKDEGQALLHPSSFRLHPSEALLHPLRFCAALSRFWWTRGYLSEGREWCERALGTGGGEARSPERAKALSGAGTLARMQGDYASARVFHEESLTINREIGDLFGIASSLNGLGAEAFLQANYALAQPYYEESLTIQREIGDRSGIANSLINLGNVAFNQGDYASARTYYEESLVISRGIGNRIGIASVLSNLGGVAYFQGDYASARAYYEESLAISQKIGDRSGIATPLNGLGNVALDQGDYTPARAYYEESLAILREIGNRAGIASTLSSLGELACDEGDTASARAHCKESLTILREIGDRWGTAVSLEVCAWLTARESKVERAAWLWGKAEALREEIGSPLSPNKREGYDRALAEVRQALGDEAFTTAWAKGRAMTLEEAIALALQGSDA